MAKIVAFEHFFCIFMYGFLLQKLTNKLFLKCDMTRKIHFNLVQKAKRWYTFRYCAKKCLDFSCEMYLTNSLKDIITDLKTVEEQQLSYLFSVTICYGALHTLSIYFKRKKKQELQKNLYI